MRIAFIIILLSLFSTECFCQIDSLKTISLDVEIIVYNQNKIKNELNSFLAKNKIVPELLQESKNQFVSNFVLTENAYFEFVSNIEKWGVINSRRIESVNYTEKLEAVNLEIKRLEKVKEEYIKLLSQVEVKSESHGRFWGKLEEAKTNLRKQNRLKEQYLGSNKKFRIKLEVREENILSNEPDFSFVNMPGIQYSFFIPSGSDGVNYPKNMNGYSIKYLMNRRKTYLELGLFKSNQDIESNKFDELYKFGIGQDFYSTHLGRGSRNVFNLYSGFNMGVFILTGNAEKLISWYATPSIGLEIYKNKNFLLDTKTGYFLPFKDNRNMRGLLMEVSLNVVF